MTPFYHNVLCLSSFHLLFLIDTTALLYHFIFCYLIRFPSARTLPLSLSIAHSTFHFVSLLISPKSWRQTTHARSLVYGTPRVEECSLFSLFSLRFSQSVQNQMEKKLKIKRFFLLSLSPSMCVCVCARVNARVDVIVRAFSVL